MGKGWKGPIKEAIAAKKGQVFTKLAREIAVAAKLGGPDPEGNARLKLAIANAKAAQCPKDTIERAIKKGSGQLDDGKVVEELTYEGYGPHQVGVIVTCQSDNKVRTVSEIRQIFKSNGGNMGETNSVSWMFKRVALLNAAKSGTFDPDEEAIEVGANDVRPGDDEGTFEFYGEISDLDTIRTALAQRGWDVRVAEIGYVANTPTELNDTQRKEVYDFLQELDDNDDTHRIFATTN